MLLDSRDPDNIEFVQQRYKNACELFATGAMSEDVFKATLYQLGFRGQAIASETNLHRPS